MNLSSSASGTPPTSSNSLSVDIAFRYVQICYRLGLERERIKKPISLPQTTPSEHSCEERFDCQATVNEKVRTNCTANQEVICADFTIPFPSYAHSTLMSSGSVLGQPGVPEAHEL